METETLNSLMQQDFNLAKRFEEKCAENEELMESLNKSVYDENFNECTIHLEKLENSTKNLVDIMKQQRTISSDLIALAKSLLNKLEKKNALSQYKDWITYFNKCLRGQVDANVWNKAQSAIYKKVESEMTNYSRSERNYVLQLETALNNVHMKLDEYELLILIKHKSNSEFHGDRFQTQTEAQEKLNTSFPRDMEVFKNALNKLFSALNLFESYN